MKGIRDKSPRNLPDSQGTMPEKRLHRGNPSGKELHGMDSTVPLAIAVDNGTRRLHLPWGPTSPQDGAGYQVPLWIRILHLVRSLILAPMDSTNPSSGKG